MERNRNGWKWFKNMSADSLIIPPFKLWSPISLCLNAPELSGSLLMSRKWQRSGMSLAKSDHKRHCDFSLVSLWVTLSGGRWLPRCEDSQAVYAEVDMVRK